MGETGKTLTPSRSLPPHRYIDTFKLCDYHHPLSEPFTGCRGRGPPLPLGVGLGAVLPGKNWYTEESSLGILKTKNHSLFLF